MLIVLLAFLGGMLTIVSPCILPVLPFVFARSDQPFIRSGLPLLIGMALTFALVATIAAVGGGWAVRANEIGRWAALALLGLFGLASFTAERRTKEIGIRKVLGARVHHIVRLLAWQFSKPVIIANLIAWPVAWWVMRDWLNGFDIRIDLTPGPFLLAGLLALAIAVGTVAGHAIKVARMNPIHALRYE